MTNKQQLMEGIKVRNVGKYGSGWKMIISDGYCSYKYDLLKVDNNHSINSLVKILIQASKIPIGKMTNKPAFPITSLQGDYNEGMTLREWYAGIAMVSFLQHPQAFESPESTAKWAFEQADLMIKEGEKHNENI